jgi:drug/metabolite transporter (DMT)-like permease
MKFLDLNKKSWQWIVLFFLAFIWGSSFILMKRGLEVYSDTEVAALRISIAFICLLPFAIKHFKSVKLKYWKYLIMVGLFGNSIPAFLFTKAQTQLSSSLSGMLNSLVPLFTLVLGLILFKTKFKANRFIGAFIGLIGAIGLITSNGINIEDSNLVYSFYVVAATVCYAISVNVINKYLKEVNSLVITALSFVFVGPIILAYLFTTDFISKTMTHSSSGIALFYTALLAIFGTAISVILFNMLIKKTSEIFATSVTYLIPIIAIFWGLIDGEIINRIQVFSIIIILIGIYFINKFK